MKVKRINLIAFVLTALGGMIVGFIVGRGSRPQPEVLTKTEIQVVKDTVEANMYRDQAKELRKEIDSLKSRPEKIKIKYEKIYIGIDTANSNELDSMFRSALRHG